MTELLILRGLPASGKTTFAKEWVSADIDNRVRVSRDDLRQALHGVATHKPPQEAAVTVAEHTMIEALLRAGRSVVVDNVNLRQKYVRQYMEIANRLGALVVVRSFEIDLDEAIHRDQLRGERGERSVGEEVIRSFHQRYITPHKGQLPPVPVLDEEHGGEPYKPDRKLPAAVLVDIDGTVALHDRSPYDYDKVLTDAPNHPVLGVVRALRRNGYRIVFMSGRPDSCREDTERWLRLWVGGDFDGPFMRTAGDDRNDGIVKVELFDKHVRHNYNVLVALDDRNRVVRAWRQLGLTCLQVADGDF